MEICPKCPDKYFDVFEIHVNVCRVGSHHEAALVVCLSSCAVVCECLQQIR